MPFADACQSQSYGKGTDASSSSVLISGDFINVLCSPETHLIVVYTDLAKYCQSRVAWVCIHVALVGMTIPATVLSPLTLKYSTLELKRQPASELPGLHSAVPISSEHRGEQCGQ